ncbi:putative metallo-hydrolase [Posidoniimonas polymericola]|uniref:Putative metallo-hydrolase n=1 Tax=Posidoniimonas polymericola TaxID=2528002 RepID=A0A5C5YPS3_9BACT|nr:MBL fold metallo-hydrolase [Posidoniimonas polymericola]TWT76906.1 putative metallo-hydrolase [Posidoniimonas polymericola]
MDSSPIRIEPIVSEFFAENAYIVWRQGDSRAVVVDPGFSPELIIEFLGREQLTPDAILLTHGHSDHIAGNQALKDSWPDCPLIIGHGDAYKLTDPQGNLSANYGVALVSPPADQTVSEGDSIEAAGIQFDTLETPGHSAGHVVFLYESEGRTHVLGGDVLFQGSVGRTDFPDGSFDDLRASIHDKLFPLPSDTVVYPGHGPTTTIGEEKQHNQFVGRSAGYDL